jgi:uncharacterized protein YutE (UPF0331/DUF86 family)
MSDTASVEDLALDRFAARWEAQGYRLVRSPTGRELPDFLGSYRPDAILLGPEKILVEVAQKGRSDTPDKLKALRALLVGHPDWRLEVLYAGTQPELIPPISTPNLRKSLSEIAAIERDEPRASLLLLWATLEAIARRLEPEQTRRPQTPGRVVEVLASEGHILPDEADFLRRASALRNRLIHGGLDVEISPDLVRGVLQVASRLLASLDKAA